VIAESLTRKDPLALGTAAGDRYVQLAKQLTAFRDRDQRGIVTDLGQLSASGANANVIAALRDSFYTSTFAIINVEIVGPKVGLRIAPSGGGVVTLYALGGMLLILHFASSGCTVLAAVLAVFHDVLITLGLFSIFHFEISLTVIAALLTLVGYSMNDHDCNL